MHNSSYKVSGAAGSARRSSVDLTQSSPGDYCAACAVPGFTVPQSAPRYLEVTVLSIVMCIEPLFCEVASAGLAEPEAVKLDLG